MACTTSTTRCSTTPARCRRAFGKAATWTHAVAAADVVIAGNEDLAERASRTARNVYVIPSCIEPRAYAPRLSYALNDPPRIVWVGYPDAFPRHTLSASRRA